MDSFTNQYDELKKHYLQGSILFAKATILKHFAEPNLNTKKELFITVVEALASLTLCNTITPNRERKVMPSILEHTMGIIEESNTVFGGEDIGYLNFFFNAILNSTERELTTEERITIESVRKRFDFYVKSVK